jgi:hypothetical protein
MRVLGLCALRKQKDRTGLEAKRGNRAAAVFLRLCNRKEPLDDSQGCLRVAHSESYAVKHHEQRWKIFCGFIRPLR